MYPVFGKEFHKLGSSVAGLSKTFALDSRRGMSCHRSPTAVFFQRVNAYFV